MTESTSRHLERGGTDGRTDTDHTGDVDADLVFMTGIFGVDAEGYDHRYSRVRGEVYRTRGGEVERVVGLEGRDIKQYIRFVAGQIGWADEWFFRERYLRRRRRAAAGRRSRPDPRRGRSMSAKAPHVDANAGADGLQDLSDREVRALRERLNSISASRSASSLSNEHFRTSTVSVSVAFVRICTKRSRGDYIAHEKERGLTLKEIAAKVEGGVNRW